MIKQDAWTAFLLLSLAAIGVAILALACHPINHPDIPDKAEVVPSPKPTPEPSPGICSAEIKRSEAAEIEIERLRDEIIYSSCSCLEYDEELSF